MQLGVMLAPPDPPGDSGMPGGGLPEKESPKRLSLSLAPDKAWGLHRMRQSSPAAPMAESQPPHKGSL